MSQPMQTGRFEIEGRGKPGIFSGVVFGLLALGQLGFAYLFVRSFYIVSRMDWATLDSRWIFPWIALASFLVFTFKAWRSFVPKRGT
jgi:hypothetical protein